MKLKLTTRSQRYIEKKIKSGEFRTPEKVVQAALDALRDRELYGDFRPGELDALIEEGERSIREEGTIPAEQVFEEIRQLARKRRKRSA